MNTNTVLEWRGHEHSHVERGRDWFWAVGIIALGIAVLSVFFGNFLFAVLIIIAAGALIIQVLKKPREFTFGIAERGVLIGKKLYPYSTLKSFWVEHTEHERQLLIKSGNVLTPYIVMPLESINPELVRSYLLEVLPEEELREPVSQKAMEYLGF